MPEAIECDAIVLPREADDEEGLYDESVITLVKELRDAGASADFQHGPESRSWIGEKALDQIALQLIIGISSNAGWDALRAVLMRRKTEQIRVQMARCTDARTGRRWEWFEAEGNGEDVVQAIEAFSTRGGQQPEDGEET